MTAFYEVVHVPLTELKPHPKREIYKTPTPIARLEKAISEDGIRDPIKVQRSTQTIIAGHTRWEVAKELQLETVPVVYYDVDDEEAESLLVRDNIERSGEEEDLIRKARTFERMKQIHGSKNGRPKKVDDASSDYKTVEELAAVFGIQKATFNRTIRLLNLIPELQNLTSQGKIGLKAGDYLSSLNQNEQKAYYERIKDEAKNNGYTVTEEAAKLYRDACRPKAKVEGEVPQATNSLHDIGEVELDFTSSLSEEQGSSDSPALVIEVPSTTSSALEFFGDETTELMKTVNHQFEFTEGIQGVEVDKKKMAEIDKISSVFADKRTKVGYKRDAAKKEIEDTKSTLFKIESKLPAVFSSDLYSDEESTELLPEELEALKKIMQRLIAKVDTIQKQFS
ncbi:ParB/RepB/Spo0J family partition protein [Alicyclobacillus fodiniaquatilis]|uniref:ParB/RepB/Spo0J family partition protein n=1 Tax=Alicyclobacillus fodiniaquatilis TaxID=1661150 RepID=A0ABW4JF11_9BACL